MGGYFMRQDKPDLPVGFGRKLKILFTVHWRGVALLLTPFLFCALVLPPPTKSYSWVAFTLCVMAVLWVTEAIPLPVTAFFPVIIFPLIGLMSSQNACSFYINDTIFVFLGSLILASAIQQSGLHNRMALCAIRVIGYSHYKLLFAMSMMTMFASMWMLNTAATTMMVPIIFALLKVFEDQKLLKTYETNKDGDKVASDMTCLYFCSATYSATVGGIGTLIGTGTNLVFKGLLETTYPLAPEYLSFPLYSAFAVPYMLVLELLTYLGMTFLYLGFLRPGSEAAKRAKVSPEGIKAAKKSVQEQSDNLGSITYWELNVAILFSFGIILFFNRSPQMFPGWGDVIAKYYDEEDKKYLRDSVVATFASFLMFWLPNSLKAFKSCTAKTQADLPKGRVMSVLDYVDMDKTLPWSYMFLLGGGFAISGAAAKKYSNLNAVMGDILSKMAFLPNAVLVLMVTIFTVFLTNFASNTAVATVIVPIGMTLANRIGANPLTYNLAPGLAASYCFMLPVGTPGNLIVQSAAKVPTNKMIVAGIIPSVVSILLTWGAVLVWAPVIWPDMKKAPKDLPWASGSTSGKDSLI